MLTQSGVQICDIPCGEGAIQAMVEAMSSEGRHGTTICWEDFKAYMTGEFTAGRNMLSGHYILPTGQALPFGLQIKRLKRHQLLDRVMAGGAARDEISKQHEHAMLPQAGQARSPRSALPPHLHTHALAHLRPAQGAATCGVWAAPIWRVQGATCSALRPPGRCRSSGPRCACGSAWSTSASPSARPSRGTRSRR